MDKYQKPESTLVEIEVEGTLLQSIDDSPVTDKPTDQYDD